MWRRILAIAVEQRDFLRPRYIIRPDTYVGICGAPHIPTAVRSTSSGVAEVTWSRSCFGIVRECACRLYAKKLDRGRFIWPQARDGVVSLTMAQLSMLLESIDWRATAWTARPEDVV